MRNTEWVRPNDVARLISWRCEKRRRTTGSWTPTGTCEDAPCAGQIWQGLAREAFIHFASATDSGRTLGIRVSLARAEQHFPTCARDSRQRPRKGSEIQVSHSVQMNALVLLVHLSTTAPSRTIHLPVTNYRGEDSVLTTSVENLARGLGVCTRRKRSLLLLRWVWQGFARRQEFDAIRNRTITLQELERQLRERYFALEEEVLRLQAQKVSSHPTCELVSHELTLFDRQPIIARSRMPRWKCRMRESSKLTAKCSFSSMRTTSIMYGSCFRASSPSVCSPWPGSRFRCASHSRFHAAMLHCCMLFRIGRAKNWPP